jgi:hypothetical protein
MFIIFKVARSLLSNTFGKAFVTLNYPIVPRSPGKTCKWNVNLPGHGHFACRNVVFPDANFHYCTLIGVCSKIFEGYALNDVPSMCILYAGDKLKFIKYIYYFICFGRKRFN